MPFHATSYPAVLKILAEFDTAVHCISSLEYAIVFVPEPTATHRVPFHATPFPAVLKIFEEFTTFIHVIPSLEYIIGLLNVVAPPTTTHRVPFHVASYPVLVPVPKKLAPRPTQFIPSFDVAIVLVVP